MNFNSYTFGSDSAPDLPVSEIGFIGDAIDERGAAALDFVSRKSSDSINIKSHPSTLEYEIGGGRYPLDNVDPIISMIKNRSVLIDATTLGFLEVFLCLRAVFEGGCDRLSLLYVEPDSYKVKRNRGVVHRRDFDLSERSNDFVGVPGRIMLMRDGSAVRSLITMGYEGARLQRLLNQFPNLEKGAVVLLGVPPFQAGWDMNAYANIVGEMSDRNLRSIMYSGAANPLGVVRHLESIHGSLNGKERLLLVPIGTKPHAIGVAMFAAKNSDVGIVYDCPERKEGRSGGVGYFHVYDLLPDFGGVS